ncbi:Hypothetical protein NTJ_02032 [Nesidiocoris tenuis]|uniref:Uncharacterized protein n=1 Tax=Nesidiocoris tenuis TaxID=355587 RepID=A0ABN7AAE5_9HEMI|nr:Hypothetical protein NTJ_02032 [Nesidiocoris tenuis]
MYPGPSPLYPYNFSRYPEPRRSALPLLAWPPPILGRAAAPLTAFGKLLSEVSQPRRLAPPRIGSGGDVVSLRARYQR